MSNPSNNYFSLISAYERWVEAQGIPVHKAYYVEDLKTLPLGRWDARDCNAAFLVLAGQEGISEARVSEIDPGKTLPPFKFGLDEIFYVLDGRGLTSFWAGKEKAKKTFEWQKGSMFLISRHYTHQITNTQGNKAARILHYNYLPLAMSLIPNADFFCNNPNTEPDVIYDDDVYSEAQALRYADQGSRSAGVSIFWSGNFFPDMRSWDKFEAQKFRGAGSRMVGIRFPGSPMWAHMPMVPPQTYKKAHRHGPGVVIVVPAGEGYSIMWEEGKEKVIVPWHEGSVFVPPNRWFHQHFNAGPTPARYLAFHAPKPISRYAERVEDRKKDQIEYTDEEPWIREKFEAELAKRGVKSLMPDEAYKQRDYQWKVEKEAS